MGYSASVESPLFSYQKRDEYQKITFRASGDDNYPAIEDFDHQGSTHVRDEYVHTLALEGGMHLDVRAVERCIVFLNGDYWGVYAMREKPDDHDYCNEYYGQDKYNIQYLQTWGRSWAQYGGDPAFADWDEIFITRQAGKESPNSSANTTSASGDEGDSIIGHTDYSL